MLKFYFCSIVLTILTIFKSVNAQNQHMIRSGIIEFEKTSNMFALIKKNIAGNPSALAQEAYDNYLKNYPQFKVLTSKLVFKESVSLFQPDPPQQAALSNFYNIPISDQHNTIYTDLKAKYTKSQKELLGETFLVDAPVQKIIWKITDETRDVAGYHCRRANGIIADSIYVVAFFTNQIPVACGPSVFSGLPGMILGVVLPHENVNWFARQVTLRDVARSDLIPPSKGTPISSANLQVKFQGVFKKKDFNSQSLWKALVF